MLGHKPAWVERRSERRGEPHLCCQGKNHRGTEQVMPILNPESLARKNLEGGPAERVHGAAQGTQNRSLQGRLGVMG